MQDELESINRTRAALDGLASEVRDLYFGTLQEVKMHRAAINKLEQSLGIRFSRVSDKIGQVVTRLDTVERELVIEPLAGKPEWVCPRCNKPGTASLFQHRGISFIICSDACRDRVIETSKWL